MPQSRSKQSKTKVLVVDDEAAIREVVGEYLALVGFEVSLAENGELALAQLEDSAFDLVISDLMMPKMNGLKLLECVRNISKDVPFILLTGSGLEGVELPNDSKIAIVHKPFSFDGLLEAINGIIVT